MNDLNNLADDYRVVGYRAPRTGEYYINYTKILRAGSPGRVYQKPKVIVEKISPNIEGQLCATVPIPTPVVNAAINVDTPITDADVLKLRSILHDREFTEKQKAAVLPEPLPSRREVALEEALANALVAIAVHPTGERLRSCLVCARQLKAARKLLNNKEDA